MLACYFVTRGLGFYLPPTTTCRTTSPPIRMASPCHPCPATWHTVARPPRCLHIVSPWGYPQLGEPLSAWRDLLCPLPESLHLKPANKTCTKLSAAKRKWPRKASFNVNTPAGEDAWGTHMHDPSSKGLIPKSEFRSQALAMS